MEDRLSVAASRSQLVTDHPNGKVRGDRQAVQPLGNVNPCLLWVVDPRPDRDEVAGGAQLVDERSRDPKACGHVFDRWRSRARLAQGCQESSDSFAHDRIERRCLVRQTNPMPLAPQCPRRDQRIHDGPQVGVTQRQWLLAAMRGRPGGLGGAQLSDERVDTDVGAQWLPPVMAA